MNWSDMKSAVAAQMQRDPQRATLSTRAIAGVEEGLRHLAGVGYNFELAPHGTLAQQNRALRDLVHTKPLSIDDAIEHIRPGMVPDSGSDQFEARPDAE